MKKNIIMENDPDYEGIPDILKGILKTRFLEGREFWFNISNRMRINENDIMGQLAHLPSGTSIIGQTNFHEEDTLEKFVHMMTFFMRFQHSINFYTVLEEQVFGTIEEVFGKYIARNTAYVTPAGQNEREYKEYLNHMLMVTMAYHKMYRMVSDDPEDDRIITYENCVLAIPIGLVAEATTA